MRDNDYMDGLQELQAIQQQIESQGAFAALIHKGRLQELTPVILAEAVRREVARQEEEQGVDSGD